MRGVVAVGESNNVEYVVHMRVCSDDIMQGTWIGGGGAGVRGQQIWGT